jgi:hypothetical protein
VNGIEKRQPCDLDANHGLEQEDKQDACPTRDFGGDAVKDVVIRYCKV